MKVATSTFNSNTTSLLGNLKNLKSLKEQQKVLTQQISQQRDKVNLLDEVVKQSTTNYETQKAVLKETADEYGENSDEAESARKTLEKYKRQLETNTNTLNEETAVLNQMNVQYENNAKEISSLDPKMQALKVTAAGLTAGFLALSKISLTALKTSVTALSKAIASISVASIEAITSAVKVSTKAFESYTTSITSALTEIGKFSTEIGSSFEKSMSNLQATLNYIHNTDEEQESLETLEEAFKELGATTQYTATEVADGAQKMALAGWKDQDILDGLSPALSLVSASGEDLVTVFDILTDAITSCGYSASDTQLWVDTMAATITNSNTTVTGLGAAFKYIGPVANTLNYSIEDLCLGLGLMANNGIKSEQAGNALKSGLTSLISPTEDAQAVMEKYNMSLTDTEGNLLGFEDIVQQMRNAFGNISDELTDANGELLEYEDIEEQLAGKSEELQKLADAAEIFGKRQVAAWLSLANSTEEDFDKLSSAIADCDEQASAMADVQMDNLQGDITYLTSAVQSVGLAIYDYIVDPLRTLVTTAKNLFVELESDITNGFNFESINKHIESFIDELVVQFNSLFPQILEGISGFSSTYNTAILSLISAAIDTAPQIIGEGGVVIVDSFWTLVNDIIDQINSSQDDLVATAGTFIIAFAEGLTSASDHIDDVLPSIVETISNGISDVLPSVLTMGKSILSTIVKGLTTVLPEILNIGSEILNYLSESLQDSPDAITDFIDNIHWALVNSIPTIFTSITSLLSGIFDSLSADDVIVGFQGLIRMVTDDFKDFLMESIPELVAFFPTFLNSFLQPLVDALLDPGIINMLVEGAVSMLTNVIEFIANNTEQLVVVLIQAITALSEALIDNADSIIPAIAEFIEGVLVGAADNTSDLLDSLLRLVDEIITVLCSPEVLTPLLKGLTELIGKVLYAIIDNLPTLTEAIVDVVLALLDILTNPKTLDQLLESVVELITDIILGVVALLPSLGAAIVRLVGALFDFFKKTCVDCDWGSLGKNIIEGIATGISNAWDYASDAISNIADRLPKTIKKLLGIASPSKVMADEVGKYVTMGLEEGMMDEAENLPETLSDIVDTMTGDIDTSFEVPARLVTATQDDFELTSANNTNGINSSSGQNNNNSQTIVNFDGLFRGATININSDDDIESLAQKLYFYTQRQSMGVGI